MVKKNVLGLLFLSLVILISIIFVIDARNEEKNLFENDNWQLTPFNKTSINEICLTNSFNSTFFCPIRKDTVRWEERNIYNPSSIVKDGKLYLIYRAEDNIGRFSGTSRIGLAWSEDGYNFTKHPEPILYPDNDFMKKYEWEGGVEDPRIFEDESGLYYIIYTAFNGSSAKLAIAVSHDLLNWEKQGLLFSGTKYENVWSKVGSVICCQVDERFVATKIDGKYWMYWGEQKDVYAAVSDDLIHWQPVEKSFFVDKSIDFDGEAYSGQQKFTEPFLRSVFSPRMNRFDSEYVEPGPQAILNQYGILLIYNSCNSSSDGDKTFPKENIAAGQILFDLKDPLTVIGRSTAPFIYPELSYEISNSAYGLTFINGLSYFKNQWFLYYDTADSRISIAVKDGKK